MPTVLLRSAAKAEVRSIIRAPSWVYRPDRSHHR
jgi:hypothetical protein